MLHMFSLSRLIALMVMVSIAVFPASAAPQATSPQLGTAESYSVLAGSIVTNIGPSAIGGNLGISPGIGTSHITGFPPGIVGPPGTIHDADASAGLAQADATAAFGALSAAPNAPCDITYGPAQDLAGLTLVPGVYCFPTSAQLTTGVALTLDGGGDADAVWIFRTGSGLNTTPGVSATVAVINTGLPCNVWWQVGSSATIGSGSRFVGNIMALTSISLGTGASLEGRALAQTGAVTLDTNSIVAPNCTPTSVELLYFRADPPSGKQVRLAWATAVEVDNFGFNLYRGDIDEQERASLIHFKPGLPQGSNSGAPYAYIDTVPADGIWWYWLADVDTQGRETLHAPISVTVQSDRYRIYVVPMVRE